MATPDHAPLTKEEVRRVAESLARWAGRHPSPHRPVIAFGGGEALSPARLAEELRAYVAGEHNQAAERFLRTVRFGLEVTSLDKILSQLEAEQFK
jgi:hypothetical protein